MIHVLRFIRTQIYLIIQLFLYSAPVQIVLIHIWPFFTYTLYFPFSLFCILNVVSCIKISWDNEEGETANLIGPTTLFYKKPEANLMKNILYRLLPQTLHTPFPKFITELNCHLHQK